MIQIFGARLAILQDSEKLRSSLPYQWRAAWSEAHPHAKGEAERLSLGGLYLLHALGAEGELVYENGKPRLDGSGIKFSISHTREAVFCAVLKNAEAPEIGLDVELLHRTEHTDAERLARRWFSPLEQEALKKEGSAAAFLEIWTRKEATVKRSGIGLSGLRAADTVGLQETGRLFYQTLRQDEFLISVCCEQHAQATFSWVGTLNKSYLQ